MTLPKLTGSTLLTRQETAEQLRVSVALLKKWGAECRGIPFIKIGRNVRYRQSDIDRYLDEHTEESGEVLS